MILDPRKDRTALRLKLYDNGYSPLANKSKMCLIKEWSTIKIDRPLIESREWARSHKFLDTGIRCGDVVALDWDIDDKDLLNDLLDEVVNQGLVDESLFVRIGRPPRELWVYRTKEKIGKRTTGHFVPAGAPQDHKGFAVEILGAGCQFAAYGQRDEDTAYQWPEQSLLDHHYMDLPEITKAQADALKDFAIKFFEDRGLERRSPAGGTDSGYTLAYDLTPDMEFDVHDMGVMSLPEIEDALRHSPEGEVLRCKVEALRPTGGSWAGMINLVNGMVCLSDHGTYTSHFPAEADIARHTERLGALLAERFPEVLAEPVTPAEDAPREIDLTTFLNPRAPLDENLATALKRFVYIENEDTVHDLRRPHIGMSTTHFRNRMAPFYTEEPQKNGRSKLTRLADLWLQHPDRMNVASMAMRPDRSFPLFEEGGGLHLNTYRPQILPDNLGDAAPGFDFIERLLPIPAERQWFMRWLAYKFQHPATRGPGVVMVANDRFGTGRGTLVKFMRALFSQEMVATVNFATLSGQTYQSQYNEWLVDHLVVVVEEAQEVSASASQWRTKHNAYEKLKEIVDPAPTRVHVVRKGRPNGYATAYSSIMVLTNHSDAMIIPRNDRRFGILENGSPQTAEYWEGLHAWIEKPENVAAFAQALRELDMGEYTPFRLPLETAAKREMVDAGSSELDRALDAAMDGLTDTLVIKEQIILKIEDYIADNDLEMPDDWRRMVERMLNRRTRKVPPGVPERVRLDGKQRVVRVVGRVESAIYGTPEAVLSEIMRNGPTSRAIKTTGAVVQFPVRK